MSLKQIKRYMKLNNPSKLWPFLLVFFILFTIENFGLKRYLWASFDAIFSVISFFAVLNNIK